MPASSARGGRQEARVRERIRRAYFHGLPVTILRSKTDPEGLGRRVAIPRGEVACPVTALRAWLEAAGINEGAVFRRVFNKRAQRVTDRRLAARNVATIVKA